MIAAAYGSAWLPPARHISFKTASMYREIESAPSSRGTIIAGKRAVTADTALRLGRFFGTSAKFRLNLQDLYDLKIAAASAGLLIIERVVPRTA